jgi:tetratricopeptide (TPR) repeat protein
VNRDHLLFLLIGLLGGFILGYVLHEAMASRQPVPAFGGAAAIPGAPNAAAAGPNAGSTGAATSGQPAMEDVQRLRAYVQENPQDADAVRALADLNYEIANWSRAAELFERYLELRPGDAGVQTDLGACLRNMGEAQRALELFRSVRAADPDYWPALFNEVLVLAIDLGDLDEAAAQGEVLRGMQPDNAQVLRLLDEIARRRQTATPSTGGA